MKYKVALCAFLLTMAIVANAQIDSLKSVSKPWKIGKFSSQWNTSPGLFSESNWRAPAVVAFNEKHHSTRTIMIRPSSSRDIDLNLNYYYEVYPMEDYYIEGRHFMTMNGPYVAPFSVKDQYYKFLKEKR